MSTSSLQSSGELLLVLFPQLERHSTISKAELANDEFLQVSLIKIRRTRKKKEKERKTRKVDNDQLADVSSFSSRSQIKCHQPHTRLFSFFTLRLWTWWQITQHPRPKLSVILSQSEGRREEELKKKKNYELNHDVKIRVDILS